MTENQDNNSYFSSDSTVKFDGSLLNLIQGAEVEYNTLGEVAEIWDGTHQTPKYIDSGIPFVSVENIKNLKATTKYISSEDFKKYKAKPQKGDILMSRIGTIGEVAVVTDDDPLAYYVTLALIRPNLEVITAGYLKHVLLGNIGKRELRKRTLVNAVPIKINLGEIGKIKIPIPSLEIQQKVVEILDKMTDYVMELTAELTAELTLRQKQYAYYRDQLLTFPSQSVSDESVSVKWMTLGEIGEVRMCKRILKSQTSSTGEVPFFKIGTFGKKPNAFISRALFEEYKEKYSYPKVGDLLISASGTIGKIVKFDGKDAYFQDSNIVWIDNDETQVRNDYLKYYYQIANWGTSQGGTITRLYNDGLKKMKIAVPPLELQYKIVEILDKFDKLTSDLSEGLPREIELRQKQYEYWREQLLSFR